MYEYMKTLLSALKIWIADELNKLSDQIKYAKSNWEQNDPNGAGYIQNRTHYDNSFTTEEKVINTTVGAYGFVKLADAPLSFDITKVAALSMYSNTFGGIDNMPLRFYKENGLYFGDEGPFVYCDDQAVAENAMPTQETGLFMFSVGAEGEPISFSYSLKIEDIKHLEPKYIKDMYYENINDTRVFLVEDLTYNDYNDGIKPELTFVVGDSYNVIWNGALYENLICQTDDERRFLGNPDDLPFYIDDDGGNNLYVSAKDGTSSSWTLSIYQGSYSYELKQLDLKFLPEHEHQEIEQLINEEVSGLEQEISDAVEGLQQNIISSVANWSQNDSEALDYIKNRPFYEDENGIHTIDPKFLPDKGLIKTQKTPDMTQLVGADENGLVYSSKIFDGIILKDSINGYEYIGEMQDGKFVTYCRCKNIEVINMPEKLTYNAGSIIDTNGMVVEAVSQNGARGVIEDYTCSEAFKEGYFTVYYKEAGGLVYETNVPITIINNHAEELIDFNYTVNDDGTYTLTSWKGTYNGEPSTKIIVPNNKLYIIEVEA